MPFSKLIIMPDGYCAWDLLWIEFFVLKFLLFILTDEDLLFSENLLLQFSYLPIGRDLREFN